MNADYSAFPFDAYTVDEIASMLRLSVQLCDTAFADACREEIKRRKPIEGKDDQTA